MKIISSVGPRLLYTTVSSSAKVRALFVSRKNSPISGCPTSASNAATILSKGFEDFTLTRSSSTLLIVMAFSSIDGLDLREAAIHKQLGSRDVAGVVGSEKYDGLRDFIGCAESAERHSIGDHLLALLAGF